mgnify:CR=1 FL=1
MGTKVRDMGRSKSQYSEDAGQAIRKKMREFDLDEQREFNPDEEPRISVDQEDEDWQERMYERWELESWFNFSEERSA